jgi:hypothetical protein
VFSALNSDRARDIMMRDPHVQHQLRHPDHRERSERAVYWPNGYRLLFRGCSDQAGGSCEASWVAAGWGCATINHRCWSMRSMSVSSRA